MTDYLTKGVFISRWNTKLLLLLVQTAVKLRRTMIHEKKGPPPVVESDEGFLLVVQKSKLSFLRFNHRRIFSFYLCYSDSCECHVQISHTHRARLSTETTTFGIYDYVSCTTRNGTFLVYFWIGRRKRWGNPIKFSNVSLMSSM